ncbi:MAG: zf-TFIIB domain-containing protein [Cupriavidus sp.]|nr:zf-TFIIB domain-containing protein [Cupriavidus sp.]
MKCPTCPDATLVLAERQGVEIDYCPQCRGVWLDRGELDKILERSETAAQSTAPRERPAAPAYESDDYGQRGHGGQRGHHGNKRRKSWLYDIFD